MTQHANPPLLERDRSKAKVSATSKAEDKLPNQVQRKIAAAHLARSPRTVSNARSRWIKNNLSTP